MNTLILICNDILYCFKKANIKKKFHLHVVIIKHAAFVTSEKKNCFIWANITAEIFHYLLVDKFTFQFSLM